MRLHTSPIVVAGALSATALLAAPVHGGACEPEWDTTIGDPGTSGLVGVLDVFDDGSGPALHIGGWFVVAGEAVVNNIARWNHETETFSDLDGGTNDRVSGLATLDGVLYVGGMFNAAGDVTANHIARWDGQSWAPLGAPAAEGTNNNVNVLLVFDDGAGDAIYAGGSFTEAGGQPASRIARWDPATETWSALGEGLGGSVWGLAVFDDGRGEALYAAGSFDTAGGQPAAGVAKWDGQSWSALGAGMTDGSPPQANTLAAFDDGTGPALYAGGFFAEAGNVPGTAHIARWDGQQWSSVGGGFDNGWVTTLSVFDDGFGEALYAGGTFTSASGQPLNRLARWDGQSWTEVGGGVGGLAFNNVATFRAFDDGSGPDLYVGGVFSVVGSDGGIGTPADGGGPASNIATWRGCAEPDVPEIPGDLTGDGTVGVDDLLILLASWGPCADCDDCPADLTGDCAVGVDDLLILLANWG